MTIWDGLTSEQWWLEHGLDGIVAGLVGGLTTGAAVAATIWWERRVRAADERARDADRNAAAQTELRRAIAQLLVATDELHSSIDGPGDVRPAARRVLTEMAVVQSVAEQLVPELALSLMAQRRRLAEATKSTVTVRRDDVRSQATLIADFASIWLSGDRTVEW